MADLCNLSPFEYEKISSVLKRDQQLRSMEEARIRQLEEELRLQATLKPGCDPVRNCARCVTELGRILNRGALCPICLKKVCKDCRHYGYKYRNHEWLCIYCYKQMQLKAISGEWMLEFSRNSEADSPKSQLEKFLQDTQSKNLMSNDDRDAFYNQITTDPVPEKPPRIFIYEPPPQNPSPDAQIKSKPREKISKSPEQRKERAPLLPRIRSWSDIKHEATKAKTLRIDKSSPLREVQQSNFKERQSYAKNRSATYRSCSVDYGIARESEPHFPVPLPRKRLNSLQKQKSQILLQSRPLSANATISDISAHVEKSDLSSDENPSASAPPVDLPKPSSNGHESVAEPACTQYFGGESSLSETDEDRKCQTTMPENNPRVRKVSYSRSDEEKNSNISTDPRLMPPLGLNHSFSHFNVCSNPFYSSTNFKQKLIGSNHNVLRSDTNAVACRKRNKQILTCSNFSLNSKACASFCNSEALDFGGENDGLKHLQLNETEVRPQHSFGEQGSLKNRKRDYRKKYFQQFPHLRKKRSKKKKYILNCSQHKTENPPKTFSETYKDKYEKNLKCFNKYPELKGYHSETSCAIESQNPSNNLTRSTSLPTLKNSTEDWLESWLRKSHSLEDWLWCLEDQPCQSLNYGEFASMLPDNYKLVYVSSTSSDSDECVNTSDLLTDYPHYQTDLNPKTSLKVISRIKNNYGTSYIEDSDWELESDDNEESNLLTNYKTGFKINEASNFLVNFDENCIYDPINSSSHDKFIVKSIRSSELCNLFHDCPSLLNSSSVLELDLLFLTKQLLCSNNYAFYKKSQSNLKAQIYRNPLHYFGRETHESLCELNELILKENLIPWHVFLNENRYSLASYSPFVNFKGENSSNILSCPQYHRFNFHKSFSDSLLFNIPSQLSALFTQYFQIISNDYFELLFYRRTDFRLSEFGLDLFEIPQVLVSLSNDAELIISLPFKAENLFLPRRAICTSPNPIRSEENIFATQDFVQFHDQIKTIVPCLKNISLIKPHILTISNYGHMENNSKTSRERASLIASRQSLGFNSTRFQRELRQRTHEETWESRTTPSDPFDTVRWWRDCCEGKVTNWLQLDDANAFHYTASLLSSYSTNRGNDNSATGWGKLRCCIAIATQRVIDLNLRAYVCEREVLDSGDLTPYFRGEPHIKDKLRNNANLVNAYLYQNPPVFPKLEVCLNRFELCLLFQKSLHASAGIRMIAPKRRLTDCSVLDKKDHECSLTPTKTERNCEDPLSSYTETSLQNENSLCTADPSWINTGKYTCQISCQMCESNNGSGKNVNKQTTTVSDWTTDRNEDFVCNHNSGNVCSSVSSENELSYSFENVLTKDYLHGFPNTGTLSSIKNSFDNNVVFKDDKNCDHNIFTLYSEKLDYTDNYERVDCQCNKPCEVPLSPSVVDATVERIMNEDGENFSSGDELDKFESDTDSQDTVIEGEAYKRIRSVAIKEKILHANEELFGNSGKEIAFDSYSSTACVPNLDRERTGKNRTLVQMSSLDGIQGKISSKSFLQNDTPELPLFSDSEESDSPSTFSSLEKSFPIFKKHNLSAFQNVSSLFTEKKSDTICNRTEASSLSSYCNSFNETTCSSESSDNGSDGEEVILSDTSTSSDEATYIAAASGFQYYSQPMSFKLHTIVEESCEESGRSSRSSISGSKSCSEFEYCDKNMLAAVKNPRKSKKSTPANPILVTNSDFKNGKSSAAYAVLATSRLEKYFKSNLKDGTKISYPDDDMTDESGEISSEDDLSSDRLVNKITSTKRRENQYKASKMSSSDRSFSSLKRNRLGSPCSANSLNNEPKACEQTDIGKELDLKSEHSTSDLKQNKIPDQVSDDEAKYIMNHLMQHISNNSEVKQENNSEMKDMSPMLKILESEIARLMLTVSPASLSAGEPSSSCSSTIGSNNSDYGSDTLESAEESTSEEEISADVALENRPVAEAPVESCSVSTTGSSDAVTTDNGQSVQFLPSNTDPVVSEETLYICKQLMASLKKIADSTDVAYQSESISTGAEDHTAKQYITDQIVSLMQTVNASQNSSPLLQRLSSNPSILQIDSDVSQDRSDSDSPPLNDDKREHSKSKTPSESGSETTISASISIPSYDDSDRTPTESEISHEMDELYALLESNSASQEMVSSTIFSYDLDNNSTDKSLTSRNTDSPLSEDDLSLAFTESNEVNFSESGSSLWYGAASKLESLLPISIEERIARYKDAFINKVTDSKDLETKATEMRINVILTQPPVSENVDDIFTNSSSLPSNFESVFNSKASEKLSSLKSCDNILSSCCVHKNEESNYNITSVKIVSHNTYPPSSAVHKILSKNIDSAYLDQKPDLNAINYSDTSYNKVDDCEKIFVRDNTYINNSDVSLNTEESDCSILSPLPKVINPKEKASSENDLLVANYRAKSKSNKVFGTKSVGNICDLENLSNKSTFRDTGYYSFKSSEESFLSLDDSTASQTSTASLTQYRSLTSTETIPEEEESCSKGTSSTKMSLSSSNIPDAVCDTSSSKSSTLPLSLRGKLSSSSNTNHRTRSSFFSTSGVLRKLTLLRDESGNSLRSSPHNRYNSRNRNRSSSGGSDDGKQKKNIHQKHEGLETNRLNTGNSEKDSSGAQDEDVDQHFSFITRSQMSLSSFGGRSESVTSVYSAAGGRRYGTVIVTGDVLFGLSYNFKAGVLEVNIKECRNLAAVDIKKNRSDPYVKVYLLPDRTKSGKRKTKVKKHTLNPVFDELLKFQVTISELEIRTLWLSVWHSDRFGRNDFLGEVMLPLDKDVFENAGLKWYPLQERLETMDSPVVYKGDLILALKYVPPDVTSRNFSKKPGSLAKGALEVLVREARNLTATRSNGTSDPFCKSYLLPDKSKAGKQKTPVIKKTCNPKWNHTFVYDDVSIDDLRERCLELTIWDYDKITSNDFLGGVRLNLGTGKYQGRDVDWMDSVGEERSLWYTMLDRPNTWVDSSLLLRSNMQSRRTV